MVKIRPSDHRRLKARARANKRTLEYQIDEALRIYLRSIKEAPDPK
jgi:hypothetical protein